MNNKKANGLQVLIGQPINYPSELVQFLKKYFEYNSKIKKAYLAIIQYPVPTLTPRLLIGLEVTSGIEKIIDDLQFQIEKKELIVGKIDFTDAINGEYRNYFLKTEPFYNGNNS